MQPLDRSMQNIKRWEMSYHDYRIEKSTALDREEKVQDSPIPFGMLKEFCKDLSQKNAEAIHYTAVQITDLRQQMVVNVFAIGERLSQLRNAVGLDKFSQFMWN